MIQVLSDDQSIVNQYLRQLRDIKWQTDRFLFALNLERLGILAGYEVSKLLNYQTTKVVTPLTTTQGQILKDRLVLATVLRAGLPLQQGLKKVFDDAEQAFVGAARHEAKGNVSIELGYQAGPSLEGKVLIMADTMIATGHSLVEAHQSLVKKHGQPARTIIVGIIASQAGLDYVDSKLPKSDIIVAAVDPQLDKNFFIVPGLGDAGDLAFGPKD